MPPDSPQLVAIRQVVDQIEAVICWTPDLPLQKEAEGAETHLSSHVIDAATERMLVFDGPRAVPGQGLERNLCVLPLAVPSQAGSYVVRIEPVVEGRFWASERGYPPLTIYMERIANGDLRFVCPDSGRQYTLPAQPLRAFVIDTPLYGLDDSERCVEIPWSVSRYRGESRVLDLGHAHAEPGYIAARNSLQIPFLVGMESAITPPQPAICGIAGHALAPPFRPGAFDLVFAVSVLKRLGRDERPGEAADLETASALASALRPGGRLVVTVPFGRFEDHRGFVQYDLCRVRALCDAADCDLTFAEYYTHDALGWHGPVDPHTLSDVAYRPGVGAGAVACLELTRRNAPIRYENVDRYIRAKQAERAAEPKRSASLAGAISLASQRILKNAKAWNKMHGEHAGMRPVMLVCETVNICNADCVFCPYSSQTRARGFMTMELFEHVLHQYGRIGGGYLSLTPMVGDPLLDRHFMSRIRRLGELRDHIIPSITTNVYALDKFSDAEVLEMLRVFRRINISCYGITAEECQAITRRKFYGRFVEQTQRLAGLRQTSGLDCEVQVGFRLITPRSHQELESFLRSQIGHTLKFGATTTYANWGNSVKGALPGDASWVPARSNESTCILLPMAVQIYWDGKVSACACCDYDSSGQLFLGDITTQSLEEIFNSAENHAVWRAHETGQLQPICRNCTFHVPLSTLHASHPMVKNPLNFVGG